MLPAPCSALLPDVGAEFEPDERGGGTRTGEEVLQRLSFADSSVRKTVANQGR